MSIIPYIKPASASRSAPKARKAKKRNLNLPNEQIVLAPRVIGNQNRQGAPRMRQSRSTDGCVVISHREFFTDVPSTGTVFANSVFLIQPGRQTMFPWLYVIANSYESYIFRKLEFQYVPRCSTGINGTVGMAVDYDAADPGASNEKEFLAMQNAVDGPVWAPLTLKCDRADLRKFGIQRFTRSGTVPTGTDIKTYDVGSFQMEAWGPVTGSLLGKLWVDYTIELHTPQLASQVLVEGLSNLTTNTGTFGLTSPFGTTHTIQGLLPLTTTGDSITTPYTGRWLGHLHSAGTGMTAGPTVTGVNGGLFTLLENLVTTGEVDTQFIFESLATAALAPTGLKFDFTGSATTITSTVLELAPWFV